MRGGLLLLCALCATTGCAETPRVENADAETIRKRHAAMPCKALKIAEPIEVSEVLYYKDGGSIGLVITDAAKQKHRFCFDGRKPGVFPIVVGVVYPTRDGGKVVDFRGPEETDLYGVLLRWANRHPARAALYDQNIEINDAAHPQLWEARQFFLRLDARFTGTRQ